MSKKIQIPIEKSIPTSIAKWLCANFSDVDFPAYFGNSLVIVPTKSAIKTLRTEILTELAKNGVKAMSAIKITTLENFISSLISNVDCASLPERIASWLQALSCIKNGSSTIFINGVPSRENLLETAKDLELLKSILIEKPASFADIYNELKTSPIATSYELSLWDELTKLESLYTEFLGTKKCKYAIIADAIRNASSSYSKIAIAGNINVPNSLKILLTSLQKTSETFVLIPTNSPMEYFDEIGRPLPEIYANKPMPISEENTFVFTSVEDEAECVANVAKQYKPHQKQMLAISCEQTQNADIFKAKLKSVGISADVPQARKLSQSALYKLIKTSAECVENNSFANFFEVLINPLMSSFVFQKTSISLTAIKEYADVLRERYILQTTQALLSIIAQDKNKDLNNALLLVYDTISKIASDSPETIKNILTEIVEIAETSIPQIQQFERESLEQVNDCIEQISKASFKFLAKEITTLLLNALEIPSNEVVDFSDTLPLNNWVEIFWSNKAHLILCDTNEGIVPMSETENQFITDSFRKRLNITNAQQRRARDAYMLESLLISRCNGAQVFYSLKDASQAPIMPSRILMQADDTNLANRIKYLFTEPSHDKLEISAPTPIKLHTDLSLPEGFTMSASKFNTYLNSPTEFYIKYILNAKEIDPYKTELDELQYGNIFHNIMETFALSKYKNSQNPQEIFAFFNSILEKFELNEFGNDIATEVKIQLYTMRQKFSAIAQIQAQRATEGWCIFEKPERKFAIDINNMRVVGSIDRVDYNEQLNKYAIIDYKTYATVSQNITQKKHYEKFDENGNILWINLQMPLYVFALQQQLGQLSECAFFVSPNDTEATTIDTWLISQEEITSAYSKMQEIIENVKQHNFVDEHTPKYEICENTFMLSKKALSNLLSENPTDI